mgnify:FL=1
MIDIIYTTITFSSMLVLFKYFGKYGVNNLQAIIVNYFTAGTLSLIVAHNNDIKISLPEIIYSTYIIPSLIIGFLFIVTFNLLAFGTQKIGIAISTVANKMSMIIPVIIGISLFSEKLGMFKLIGIVLAISAIYMTSTKSGKLSFDKKFLPIILLIFFGQGMADGTLSWAQKFSINDENTPLFFASVFLIAGILGSVFLIYETIKNGFKLEFKNLIWGIGLGIPNYLTLHFFVRSLQSPIFESSQVFPIVNMGVIVFTALAGILLFREKLSFFNWGGILVAVLAISLITFF